MALEPAGCSDGAGEELDESSDEESRFWDMVHADQNADKPSMDRGKSAIFILWD